MNVSPKEDEIVVVRMSYFEFPTKRNEISDFLGLDCGYLRKYFEYNCKYRTVWLQVEGTNDNTGNFINGKHFPSLFRM